MSKHTKKRSSKVAVAHAIAAKPGKTTAVDPGGKSGPTSKQAVVIEMLRAPTGATIGAMMQSTGWQQHSVRGFLAGVVRKKLNLQLSSKKTDGSRIYRINGGGKSKSSGSGPRRRAA